MDPRYKQMTLRVLEDLTDWLESVNTDEAWITIRNIEIIADTIDKANEQEVARVSISCLGNARDEIKRLSIRSNHYYKHRASINADIGRWRGRVEAFAFTPKARTESQKMAMLRNELNQMTASRDELKLKIIALKNGAMPDPGEVTLTESKAKGIYETVIDLKSNNINLSLRRLKDGSYEVCIFQAKATPVRAKTYVMLTPKELERLIEGLTKIHID